MGPHQGSVEGKENLPQPAGHTPLNAPQDAIGLLGCQGTLLAHGQPVIPQDTQVPLRRAALQQVHPKPALMHEVVPPQAQEFSEKSLVQWVMMITNSKNVELEGSQLLWEISEDSSSVSFGLSDSIRITCTQGTTRLERRIKKRKR